MQVQEEIATAWARVDALTQGGNSNAQAMAAQAVQSAKESAAASQPGAESDAALRSRIDELEKENATLRAGTVATAVPASAPPAAPAKPASKPATAPAGKVVGGAEWSVGAWVESLPLAAAVAAPLAAPAGADAFGWVTATLSEEELQTRLGSAGLGGLSPLLWGEAQQLRAQGAATGTALNAKFAGEADFQLAFGGLDMVRLMPHPASTGRGSAPRPARHWPLPPARSSSRGSRG